MERVEPTAVGERLVGLGLDGQDEGGKLQLLVDGQAVLLHQLAAYVPEGGHVRINQQRHIQVLGQGVALLLLLQGSQLLLPRLAAVRDEGAMGMIVNVLGAPRLQAQVVLHMHHRRLVAVRLLGYDLKGGPKSKYNYVGTMEHLDPGTYRSASFWNTAFMSWMIFSQRTFFSLRSSSMIVAIPATPQN